MGQTMSYAEVRDFVMSMAGADCCLEAEALEVLMVNCLEDIRNRVGTEPHVLTTASLSVVVGTDLYTKPVPLDQVLSVDRGNRELMHRRPPSDEVLVVPSVDENVSVGWWEEFGQIQLWPTPTKAEVLLVRGTVNRDRTLFDVDAGGVRTWRVVDLPAELHTVFAKLVLGMATVQTNPGVGQMWMERAADELIAWKNWRDRQKSPGRKTLMFAGRALERRRSQIGFGLPPALSAADLYEVPE